MKLNIFKHIIVLMGIFCVASPSLAQKYPPRITLVLDHYSSNRIRLAVGSEIYYKLRGDKNLYHDYIDEFWEADTAVLLVQSKVLVKLYEFDAFYFRRNWVRAGSTGLGFIGGGFGLAAITAPLFPVRFYDPTESAIIGGTSLVLSQAVKLFRWKKFKIREGKSRIRIVNTSFGPMG